MPPSDPPIEETLEHMRYQLTRIADALDAAVEILDRYTLDSGPDHRGGLVRLAHWRQPNSHFGFPG